MSKWLGALAGFLPGADQMSEADKMALVRQGLLAAGLGIMKNNQGNYGKAGPAIGAGLSEGLLAMNKGADGLADQRYKQQVMERQMGDPAGFRALDMQARAAGYEPGTQGYMDFFRRENGELARQSSAAYGYQVVTGPDGKPRLVVTDPRNPLASPLGADGQPAIPPPQTQVNIQGVPPEQQQRIASVVDAMAQAGYPDEQIDAFVASQLPQEAPTFAPAPALPPRKSAGPNPFVGQSPMEKTYGEEAGRQAAQIDALPVVRGIENQADIDLMRAETGIKPTAAQTAVDSAYGKDYVEFMGGGAADANKALGELDGVIKALEGGANFTGPVLGATPKFLKDRVAPAAAAAQETVESTVQRSLRVILGAQFTEKEGERLIARAYNPSLPEAENLKRVKRLFQQLQEGFENKAAAARYYEANGSLRGFTGKLPSWGDFETDAAPRSDGSADPLGIL